MTADIAPAPTIEPMTLVHWPAVHRIYVQGIATGDATLEHEAPDWNHFDHSHRRDCRLVARDGQDGRVVGWIESLARRARVPIPDAGPSTEVAELDGAGGDGDDLGLTAREREVLALVAEGYTNRRIAGRLFISESTAGVHVSNILGKLNVASRTEAATVAARLGLVD